MTDTLAETGRADCPHCAGSGWITPDTRCARCVLLAAHAEHARELTGDLLPTARRYSRKLSLAVRAAIDAREFD